MDKYINDVQTPYIETHKTKKPNYRLRRLGALVTAALLLVPLARSASDVYDKLTVDDITYSTTANIVPNPTSGGQEALQQLIESGTTEERQAAQNVDVAELGSLIAKKVFDTTGQSPREITHNVPVTFTFEEDGDLTDVEVLPKQ